jgi:hypothetical protein
MIDTAFAFLMYTISGSIIVCVIMSVLDTLQDWKRINKIMEKE